MLIHPENSAMIGKVALFLDVYPEYKCETYRFRFPESENSKMKKKEETFSGQTDFYFFDSGHHCRSADAEPC